MRVPNFVKEWVPYLSIEVNNQEIRGSRKLSSGEVIALKEKARICPICEKKEIKSNNKTCGDPICRGKYAEYKTKKRTERQKEAEPQIRKWADQSKIDWGDKKVCVVCRETLNSCLTDHHFNKQRDKTDTVILCWNCHQVFSSRGSGLEELKIRRKKYYEYNRKS